VPPGLYGLIVALIIAVKDGSALCGCQVHADGSILCTDP